MKPLYTCRHAQLGLSHEGSSDRTERINIRDDIGIRKDDDVHHLSEVIEPCPDSAVLPLGVCICDHLSRPA
jgi:hypothetical protein